MDRRARATSIRAASCRSTDTGLARAPAASTTAQPRATKPASVERHAQRDGEKRLRDVVVAERRRHLGRRGAEEELGRRSARESDEGVDRECQDDEREEHATALG